MRTAAMQGGGVGDSLVPSLADPGLERVELRFPSPGGDEELVEAGGAGEPVELAAIGAVVAEGSGEQSLARDLYPRLEEDRLLIADQNCYNWADWRTAAGAALLWWVGAHLCLPVLELLPDGSYQSVLLDPTAYNTARCMSMPSAI
jgi:hypothetical protein